MNFNKLQKLVKSSNLAIDKHTTIEANKVLQQRPITPPQSAKPLQSDVRPQQRPITPPQSAKSLQSDVRPQQRPITPPQSAKPLQSDVRPQQRPITPPQSAKSLQSDVRPQQRPITPPQSAKSLQSDVRPQQRPITPPQLQNNLESYAPFNDAPVLNLGQDKSEAAQRVVHKVAQDTWVAQSTPNTTLNKSIADQDVEIFKEQIFQIDGVEARKKFVRDIGWGILTEKRGKKYYLFGAKKINRKKYKLYIGNVTA
jgi:hypothetical protein